MSPFGVMFHHFHINEKKKYGQGSINEKEFEKIIIFLKKNFQILAPAKWIHQLRKKKLKKKNICLTFDDALLSQYDIALKVLNKHKLKAFWFIYSSVFHGKLDDFEIQRKFRSIYYKNFEDFFQDFQTYLGKSLTFKKKTKYKKYFKSMNKFYPIYSKTDIEFRYIRDYVLKKNEYDKILSKMMVKKKTTKKKLSKNLWLTNSHLKKLSNKDHIIGLHAYNHPYKLAELNFNDQQNEINKNYIHLNNLLRKKPISISYPNGSFNNNTLKIVKKLGVICGFTSNMKNYREFNSKDLLIKRLDHSFIIKNYIK